jgi:hypothetical protein
MTFRGLQAESAAQGQIHRDIAKDIQTLVVEPFNVWAQDYKVLMLMHALTSFNPCQTGAARREQGDCFESLVTLL